MDIFSNSDHTFGNSSSYSSSISLEDADEAWTYDYVTSDENESSCHQLSYGGSISSEHPHSISGSTDFSHHSTSSSFYLYGDEDDNNADRTQSAYSSLHNSSPATKKRKTSDHISSVEANQLGNENSMCPICLTEWRSSGEHVLVSLQCGHLFGKSCIKRWLHESYTHTGMSSCAQCKAPAETNDIRRIYAKTVQVTESEDRAHMLEKDLKLANEKCTRLQNELAIFQVESFTREQNLRSEIDRLIMQCHCKQGQTI